MHFNYITSIVNIAVTWAHVFLSLAAAILIYIKHHEPKNRSQWYALAFFSLSTIVAIGDVYHTLHTQRFLDDFILFDPKSIFLGFITFLCIMLYLVEVLRPNFLTLKRTLLLISPWLICAAVTAYFMATDSITRVYTVSKLNEVLHNPDVPVRIILAGMLFPYAFWICSLCFRGYSAYKCPRPMMRTCLLIVAFMTITFFFSRGMQFFPAYMLHEALFIALGVLIIYVEHYERLHIPYESVRTYYTPTTNPVHTTAENSIQQAGETLCQLLEDPQIWQNPEITVDQITQMAGTNHTYIQAAAKSLGFKSVTDMLHRRRIEHICQRLRKDPTTNLQSLFFEAGYNSRTTAWRNFVAIVGCPPTEFAEKNTPPQQNKINN